MLLPENFHPKQSIYFNGAMVLAALENGNKLSLLDLYLASRQRHEMSLPVFLLSLDWLYLINAIALNSEGTVELCS